MTTGTATGERAPRRRRLWLILLVPLLAAVVGVGSLPWVLDVERHRGRIEGAMHDATGWEAELGEIDLSVWRGIVLSVRPVSLRAPQGDSRFDAGEVVLHASWMPLFRGRLEIRSVEFLDPDVLLVRPDADRGWVLPAPPLAKPAGSAAADDATVVRVARIEVRQGSLRLEDRSVEPPLALAVETVEAEFVPATGAIEGTGAIPGDGGRIGWSGSPDQGLEVRLERVSTDVIGPWLGDGVLHPGGRFAGELEVSPAHGVAGTLRASTVRALAGTTPVPEAELDFRFVPDGDGWGVERLELRAGEAVVVGSGSLVPLTLELELAPAPLEASLALLEALVPLGLELSPPGTARVEARIDLPDAGPLSYEAEGEIAAARLVVGELLPEVAPIRAAFRLARDGELVLKILEGSVGGGPLKGTVRIDRIDPPGTLFFEGAVAGASFGALLGGIDERAPGYLTGLADVGGEIAIGLGGEGPDLASMRGEVTLGAADVGLSGWSLEAALREAVREELGGLAEVAARVSPAAAALLEEGAREGEEAAERLLERVAAAVEFDAAPWGLEAVDLTSGGVSATGQGTFDPETGTIDLRLAALLDPELTRRYLNRFPDLDTLVDGSGRIHLPVRMRGPLSSPGLSVDLSRLMLGPDVSEEPKEAARKLLEGLLERELGKKKK